jgi:hypothetical protein
MWLDYALSVRVWRLMGCDWALMPARDLLTDYDVQVELSVLLRRDRPNPVYSR